MTTPQPNSQPPGGTQPGPAYPPAAPGAPGSPPPPPPPPPAPAGPGPAPDQAPPPATAPARPARTPPAPSRIGAAWVAAIGFAVVLLLLLIFILQNSQKVEVSFFGAHGHTPMGVALLLAAVFGILLVAIPGSIRILQLRWRDRRNRRAGQRQP